MPKPDKKYMPTEDRAKQAKDMLMKKGMVTPQCADCGIPASSQTKLQIAFGVKLCLRCLGKREAREVHNQMKAFEEKRAYQESFEDFS